MYKCSFYVLCYSPREGVERGQPNNMKTKQQTTNKRLDKKASWKPLNL